MKIKSIRISTITGILFWLSLVVVLGFFTGLALHYIIFGVF